MGDAGIELMAHPFKTRRRVADFVRERSDAANVKVKLTALTVNRYLRSKPQISLAFGPQESDGRDVLRIDPPIG